MENKSIATTEAIPQKMEPETNLISEQPTITKMVDPISALVPEEARAETGSVPEDMKRYEQLGLFNPTAGMAQITNKFGGRLFAYVSQEESGNRWVHFLQQYETGEYSPEFVISQSDLLMADIGNKTTDQEMKKESRKCLRRIWKDYLDKSCGMEITNISEVISCLSEILNTLPVVSEGQELTQAQLYSMILDIIKNLCPEVFKFYRRGGYFILCDSEISRIAHEMGMSERKLLEQLKKKRLLYLTDSCRGYQVKVPTHKGEKGNAIFEWAYCLLDMEYFSRKIDPQKASTVDELTSPLENWDE